jgi:hypothetical protein
LCSSQLPQHGLGWSRRCTVLDWERRRRWHGPRWCRVAAQTRLQGEEMHRGERKNIFTPPLSSKAKCLTHLPPLLEYIFLMHADLRLANLLLHPVVEVSLTTPTRTPSPLESCVVEMSMPSSSHAHGRRRAGCTPSVAWRTGTWR